MLFRSAMLMYHYFSEVNLHVMKNIMVVLLALSLISCTQKQSDQTVQNSNKDPYGHIPDDKVRVILKSAIDRAGGISTWRSLNEIRYRKRSVLYFNDGAVESEVTQDHVYQMSPEFEAEISWEKDGDQHLLQYASEGARKFVNDTLQTTAEEGLKQSVMSAIYVLGMPFKLLDEGVQLTYEGVTDFEGFSAHAIEARYSSESHDNHSTDDLWWYYFDEKNAEFLGAVVYHPPTYALLRNLEFDRTTPIKFHAHRKSYRSDSMRNKAFLRAQFWYDNYQVN